MAETTQSSEGDYDTSGKRSVNVSGNVAETTQSSEGDYDAAISMFIRGNG